MTIPQWAGGLQANQQKNQSLDPIKAIDVIDMPKATSTANANIALVKYWGKRDSKLILPQNGSISMTCDGLSTITTVEFSPEYKQDIIIINDEELRKDEKDVLGHLDRIRSLAKISDKAKVVSETNFPVAAGLASSASGLAAITLASAKSAGLNLNQKDLTILTRQGSGSACRSICDGFVEWHKGQKEDGSDSFAETIAPKTHWPEFRMIATILSEKKKLVDSRGGMSQSVANCPYYFSWVKEAEKDLNLMRIGIEEKNFEMVGSTAESSCLKMHAVMMTTTPAIIYWIPQTLEVINNVRVMRQEGIQAYFTIDGGPQVKVICLEKDSEKINKKLQELESVKKTVICKPGDGARLLDKHLF